MKNKGKFHKKVKNQNGDIFWNGVEVEKILGTKGQLEDVDEKYDFHDKI